MGEELYVVARISQEAADIEKLVSDLRVIERTLQRNKSAVIRVPAMLAKNAATTINNEISALDKKITHNISVSVTPKIKKSALKKAQEQIAQISNDAQSKMSSGTIASTGNKTAKLIYPVESAQEYKDRYASERQAKEAAQAIKEMKQAALSAFTQMRERAKEASGGHSLKVSQVRDSAERIRAGVHNGTYLDERQQLTSYNAHDLASLQRIKAIREATHQEAQETGQLLGKVDSILRSRLNEVNLTANKYLKEATRQITNDSRLGITRRDLASDNLNFYDEFVRRTGLDRISPQMLENMQRTIDSNSSGNNTNSNTNSGRTDQDPTRTRQAFATLLKQMESFGARNPKLFTDSQYARTFNELHAQVRRGEGDINRLRLAYKQFEIQVNQAGLTGKTSVDNIMSQASKFTQWFSISQVIMRAVTEVQRMYNAVKDVDDAMTELKKVTNETTETYNNFLDSTIVRANELGVKVSNLVASTADFSRSGVGDTLEETTAFAEAANVYLNVGDGLQDIDEASQSIISTTKAFGDEIQGPMQIVDKFNEVGNNFSITSGGIGEALQRSASALKSAGNDIDESIGLIVAANSVVQDPDVVGTALKTISMRIRGAKAEDLELEGLDTDGLVESVSTLREELLALSGVDIMLDDSTFRSTTDILIELSEVWDDLSDITQANIIEKIAGKFALAEQKCAA